MIYILKIKHKKTWNSTVVVPRFEAFALPIILEQQREAHAEMYVYLYTFVRRIMRLYEACYKTSLQDI